MQVQNVEAKVGRKGFIKIVGDLPMASPSKVPAADKGRIRSQKNHINVEAHGLEMRLRNSYTGAAPLQWISCFASFAFTCAALFGGLHVPKLPHLFLGLEKIMETK